MELKNTFEEDIRNKSRGNMNMLYNVFKELSDLKKLQIEITKLHKKSKKKKSMTYSPP